MRSQTFSYTKGASVAAAIVFACAGGTPAVAVDFDFGSNQTEAANIQQTLSSTYTDNGVTATAYEYDTTTGWITSELWARSETNDHGLGVCSADETNCTPSPTGGYVGGGGDRNELSNQKNGEAILLTRPDDHKWTSLWVSSLDGGGTGASEEGVFYYGDTNDIGTLLLGSGVDFAYSAGDPVEMALDSLITEMIAASRYILFTHRSTVGDNNDYLVWKGAIEPVPEEIPGVPAPAPLALLGIGGLALGWMTRKPRG